MKTIQILALTVSASFASLFAFAGCAAPVDEGDENIPDDLELDEDLDEQQYTAPVDEGSCSSQIVSCCAKTGRGPLGDVICLEPGLVCKYTPKLGGICAKAYGTCSVNVPTC